MTLPIEIGRRLDLQLGSLDIAAHSAAALELQQVLDFNGAGDLSHDVGLLAMDIALDIAIGSNNNFC